MSETVYRIGLMANIAQLRGKDENTIYEFFKCRGIIPLESFEENGIYSDLWYDDGVNEFSCLIAGNQVYIIYLLADSNSNSLDTLVTPMSQMKRIAKVMQKKFNGSDISLYNYEWYTGTDEPCVVDCRFTREKI